MSELQINYLAVGIAAIVPMFLGAIWYSPLMFGKLWMTAHGHTPEKLETMKKQMGRAYLVSMLCYLIMAFALAILVSLTGASSMAQGAGLGLLVWLGFLATVGLTGHMFSDNRLSAYLLDVGFQGVYAVIMGMILAAWH